MSVTRSAPDARHAAEARRGNGGDHESTTFTRAAGGLVHPVPILAIVVLVLNDHWWKLAYGSWLTGKLSDLAGLVFFPLLLEAVTELGAKALGRYDGPSIRRLLVMILVTCVGFVAVKTSALGAEAYGLVLGAARWPFYAAIAWIDGQATPRLVQPDIVRDPSDLLTLVGVLVSYFVGRARTREHLDRSSISEV